MEHNFPNAKIVEMYLSNNNGDYSEDDCPHLAWQSPKTEMLVDYLVFHQHWEPSYIRQRMLPMLSTIFLRDMASNRKDELLYDQYEFDSIQRVKVKLGHQFFVISWKKAAPAMDNTTYSVPTGESHIQMESNEHDESLVDPLDEDNAPQICLDDGRPFLSTDESMALVKAAFPEKVDQFFKEKELKEMKSKRKKATLEGTPEKSESTRTRCVQLSITEFYRSSKMAKTKTGEGEGEGEDLGEKLENGSSMGSSRGKRRVVGTNFSKSARRRLLF